MSVKHVYLLAIAALIACASSGTSDTSKVPPPPIRGNVLTAEEIANTHADVNTAYDALSRLRGNWLAPHGAMSSNSASSPYAAVFVDGQYTGDISYLRTVPAYYVAEIHYYDVTQAGAKFGLRAGTTGAIEVIMKKP